MCLMPMDLQSYCLTVPVKAATFPLTKQQVESTLAMQNLQPKIKAIQQRYAGNQERIQLETSRLYKQAGVNPLAGCFLTLATIPVWIGLYQALSNVANEGLLTEGFFWIPSLGGPTTIAARQSGSGVSWLFPFVDGHPPLGWHDTAAYLVLPILLIVSQYTDDPAQKNTLWFSSSFHYDYFVVCSIRLTIYWFTNNVLTTAQQISLNYLFTSDSDDEPDDDNSLKDDEILEEAVSSSSKEVQYLGQGRVRDQKEALLYKAKPPFSSTDVRLGVHHGFDQLCTTDLHGFLRLACSSGHGLDGRRHFWLALAK
ncbi:Inner membrane protein ALBINO3, chloroplastic [Datura stramonium]|uniref:Inner membrane protein ALBINO3, chloroplastic n=1 Tax=Datura stramonium TaxID=4076 RepID=A0ABS8RJ91_DATST|nr:Inner membrane protein ALBINO3, chloroplastic [Datura stramonium]